jgi:hypothetical protein
MFEQLLPLPQLGLLLPLLPLLPLPPLLLLLSLLPLLLSLLPLLLLSLLPLPLSLLRSGVLRSTSWSRLLRGAPTAAA